MPTTVTVPSTTIGATSFVPLTTTFYPNSNCFTSTHAVGVRNGINQFTLTAVQTDFPTAWWLSLGPLDWATCFPSGYQSHTGGYFSPGICPSGYSVASSSLLAVDLTQAACCPSEYQWNSHIQYAWETTQPCSLTNSDFPRGIYGFATTSASFSGAVNARAVFIKWGSSDFPLATATGEPIISATPSAHRSSSGNLSKAWIAGPVVGSVLGCAAIALAVLWYIRREGKQQLPKSTSTLVELASEKTHLELPTRCAPQELGTENQCPHELP